jgi:hypothetical protein
VLKIDFKIIEHKSKIQFLGLMFNDFVIPSRSSLYCMIIILLGASKLHLVRGKKSVKCISRDTNWFNVLNLFCVIVIAHNCCIVLISVNQNHVTIVYLSTFNVVVFLTAIMELSHYIQLVS